jgi:hypothetical protein
MDEVVNFLSDARGAKCLEKGVVGGCGLFGREARRAYKAAQ